MFLTGQPQRKGVSPITGNSPINPMKSVSSVNLSPSAPPVTSVLSAVEGLADCKNFGKSGPKTV